MLWCIERRLDSSVSKVRFGEFAYKVIEPVPAGEYAPSRGELLQHVHVPARMPLAPTLRRRQPQTVEPHPELKEVLLPESRTRRLYPDFFKGVSHCCVAQVERG